MHLDWSDRELACWFNDGPVAQISVDLGKYFAAAAKKENATARIIDFAEQNNFFQNETAEQLLPVNIQWKLSAPELALMMRYDFVAERIGYDAKALQALPYQPGRPYAWIDQFNENYKSQLLCIKDDETVDNESGEILAQTLKDRDCDKVLIKGMYGPHCVTDVLHWACRYGFEAMIDPDMVMNVDYKRYTRQAAFAEFGRLAHVTAPGQVVRLYTGLTA